MAVDGLAIDVFGALVVGLEDDVGFGLFEGLFERGILATAKVFGDVFGTGDHAGKTKTGFGIGGDIIGEIFGVATIADDDGLESGATIALEGDATSGADGLAEETEEEKAREDGIESHDANREKVDLEEKVVSDNRHDADDGGEKKPANLGPAVAAQENGFAIEAESS